MALLLFRVKWKALFQAKQICRHIHAPLYLYVVIDVLRFILSGHGGRFCIIRAKIARFGPSTCTSASRPSARPACTRAPRRPKPRTVQPPLPSPAPAAGLRTSSVHARCSATPRGHLHNRIIIYRLIKFAKLLALNVNNYLCLAVTFSDV